MDDFRDPFEVKLSKLLAETPLLIPLVVEHIWAYYSSRQVWQAIGEKDLSSVWRYAKGLRARDLRKPGGALHVLQAEWDNLLQNFEEVFVQPRVFFDWTGLKNTTFLSVVMQAPSSQEMLDAVFRMSERSMVTALKPSIELNGRCHLSCFLPSDQIAAVVRIVGEAHPGTTPPLIAIQDPAGTPPIFPPSFFQLNWSWFLTSCLALTF